MRQRYIVTVRLSRAPLRRGQPGRSRLRTDPRGPVKTSARRSRFTSCGAGTRSRSRVARMTPCAPQARPPTITYRTPARLSAATSASGPNRCGHSTRAPAEREPQPRSARFDGQGKPLLWRHRGVSGDPADRSKSGRRWARGGWWDGRIVAHRADAPRLARCGCAANAAVPARISAQRRADRSGQPACLLDSPPPSSGDRPPPPPCPIPRPARGSNPRPAGSVHRTASRSW